MSTKESQRQKRLFYTSQGLTCEGKVRVSLNGARKSIRKLVCGIGVHDLNISCRDPSVYDHWCLWSRMLRRCYSNKHQVSHPTYIGCSVCPEWLCFSGFVTWVNTQEESAWRTMDIDKDILVICNKQYSPDSCVFVNSRINSFFVCGAPKKSGLPVGVTHCGSRYEPSISTKHEKSNGLQKRRSTSTSEESRMIYLQYKASRALELIPLTNHKGVVARLQYEHRIMTEEANTIAEKLITTNDITTYC